MSRPRSSASLACLALIVANAGCEDAALRRLENSVARDVVMLTAISQNRSQFEREADELRRERTQLDAAFRAVESSEVLAAAIADGGGTVRSGDTRTRATAGRRTVAFRIDSPARVRAMLGLDGGGRRPLAVDALDCGRDGCTGELAALARPSPVPSRRPPAMADLGRRPIWPPARSQWDRARAGLEQLEALRASLGPLADIRDGIVELKALRDAIDVPRRRTALVVDVANDALAAGASGVQVVGFDDGDGYGATVVGAGATDALAGRLARHGKVTKDGGGLAVRVELPEKAAVRKLLEKAGKTR